MPCSSAHQRWYINMAGRRSSSLLLILVTFLFGSFVHGLGSDKPNANALVNVSSLRSRGSEYSPNECADSLAISTNFVPFLPDAFLWDLLPFVAFRCRLSLFLTCKNFFAVLEHAREQVARNCYDFRKVSADRRDQWFAMAVALRMSLSFLRRLLKKKNRHGRYMISNHEKITALNQVTHNVLFRRLWLLVFGRLRWDSDVFQKISNWKHVTPEIFDQLDLKGKMRPSQGIHIATAAFAIGNLELGYYLSSYGPGSIRACIPLDNVNFQLVQYILPFLAGCKFDAKYYKKCQDLRIRLAYLKLTTESFAPSFLICDDPDLCNIVEEAAELFIPLIEPDQHRRFRCLAYTRAFSKYFEILPSETDRWDYYISMLNMSSSYFYYNVDKLPYFLLRPFVLFAIKHEGSLCWRFGSYVEVIDSSLFMEDLYYHVVFYARSVMKILQSLNGRVANRISRDPCSVEYMRLMFKVSGLLKHQDKHQALQLQLRHTFPHVNFSSI